MQHSGEANRGREMWNHNAETNVVPHKCTLLSMSTEQQHVAMCIS